MRVHRCDSIECGWSLASLALLAAGLAGCFSDRGVAIEVDIGSTQAQTVELYLGAQACDPKANTAGITCTSIAPPDGTLALPGNVWFRDALPPETADAKNGKAAFQLRADTPTTLPIVIAVGFTSSGQPTTVVGSAMLRDVSVPVNNARVITTTLGRATMAMPGTTNKGTDDRVLIWRKATPPSSCVMVEHGSAFPVARDFVVPAEDPDCDDVPAPECNPAAFHGTNLVAGARDRPDCFSSSGGPACVLGAFGCTDGTPSTDSNCSPLAARTCIPQGFCDTGCNSYDDACMRGRLEIQPSPVARIECTVPTTLSLGEISLCPNRAQAPIDLGMFFPSGQCPAPEIGALPGVAFDDRHSFGGATMKLSSPARPCQFTVTWTDGMRAKIAAPDDAGILRFQPEAGPTLLLPIVFHFSQLTDSCLTTDFQCHYVGDPQDSMWSCAR